MIDREVLHIGPSGRGPKSKKRKTVSSLNVFVSHSVKTGYCMLYQGKLSGPLTTFRKPFRNCTHKEHGAGLCAPV